MLGGIFGALFITVSTYMSFYRKKYINSDWKKMIETGMFGFLTISLMTSMVIWQGECYDIPYTSGSDLDAA